MDNFDFVAHLASTAGTLEASLKVVEDFVHSYYQKMHAVALKWSGGEARHDRILDQAFSELNAIHQKYWLAGTCFTEYWQPALGSPDRYHISTQGITIFQDMLGNFVVVVRTAERTAVYLLSVVCDELKIVNEFF